MSKIKFGLLLPHFGKDCSIERILKGSVKAEKLGFNAVWVRDHIIFHPHAFEGTNNDFLDPFVTLASISSVTTDLILGTAVIIPLRHPLVTALKFSTLSNISNGRVIAGFGAGNFKVEFDAIGIPFDKRPTVVKENVEIFRKVWKEDDVSYDGEIFSFKNVTINPKPVKDIPIWYGGATPASTRRATSYCDGWFPGRINLPTFDVRLKQIEKALKKSGKPKISIGAIPITSIDKKRDIALKKINLKGLIEAANNRKWWKKPPSGRFEKIEDLEGSLIAGNPEDCCKEVEKYVQRGTDHLVFDFRYRFDEFDECLTLLGEEVIPNF